MAKGLPPLTPVESSNIAAIGHRGSDLFVRFKGGGLYSYEDVSADKYAGRLEWDSIGKWFSSEIRGKHPHQKHDDV